MNALLKSVATAAIALSAVAFQCRISAQNAAPQASRPARPAVTVGSQGALPEHAKFTHEQIEAGGTLLLQNCAFCHGKDAGGGESGPDLTRSKLVMGDKNGEAIGVVVHNGRLDKGMPRFNLSDAEVVNLAAFIHSQQDKAMSQTGTRKGVDEVDLRTGNAAAGKVYYTANCASCHSTTGDLKDIASRYSGLQLMEQMLYPKSPKVTVTVKTTSGQTYNGPLEYHDEFHIGMKDGFGTYHSWPVSAITYTIQDPAQKHVEIMSHYTDKDMHDVYAFLETLK